MAVRPAGRGKRAVTRYRVLERFAHFTVLELHLETGRTHQIRVHLASLGHPVVGDQVYGKPRLRPPVVLDGYALHAAALAFVHPAFRKTRRVLRAASGDGSSGYCLISADQPLRADFQGKP